MEISVVIPTYKPCGYIYECLESLLNQTLSCDLFEIIIVLNGCKEPYETNIKRYIQEEMNGMNVSFIQIDEAGVSNARNIGLKLANGKYICFLDDDDAISENYFEKLLQIADNQYAIAVSNVYNFYKEKSEHIKDYLTITNNSTYLLKNRRYLSNACCKLIPRTIIGNREFDLYFAQAEDALFMFSISDKIKRVNKASDCIYYRRLRESSASRKRKRFLPFLKTTILLQYAFTVIYFSNPFKYNFLLYLSRLLAVWKR